MSLAAYASPQLSVGIETKSGRAVPGATLQSPCKDDEECNAATISAGVYRSILLEDLRSCNKCPDCDIPVHLPPRAFKSRGKARASKNGDGVVATVK